MPLGRQVLGHDKVLSEHLIMFLMETFLRVYPLLFTFFEGQGWENGDRTRTWDYWPGSWPIRTWVGSGRLTHFSGFLF